MHKSLYLLLKEFEHSLLILLQLRSQLLWTIKLPFSSDSLHKTDEQKLIIDIAVKIEDVCLQRYLLAIEGGASADVHHTPLPYHGILHASLHCIDTRGRDELTKMGNVEVGSRETQLPSLMIAIHHR